MPKKRGHALRVHLVCLVMVVAACSSSPPGNSGPAAQCIADDQPCLVGHDPLGNDGCCSGGYTACVPASRSSDGGIGSGICSPRCTSNSDCSSGCCGHVSYDPAQEASYRCAPQSYCAPSSDACGGCLLVDCGNEHIACASAAECNAAE